MSQFPDQARFDRVHAMRLPEQFVVCLGLCGRLQISPDRSTWDVLTAETGERRCAYPVGCFLPAMRFSLLRRIHGLKWGASYSVVRFSSTGELQFGANRGHCCVNTTRAWSTSTRAVTTLPGRSRD